MRSDLNRYLVNPGPKSAARGLAAAVTSDSAIATEAMVKVLAEGGNAADAGIAGAMVQAAVEPYVTNHAGQVTCLYYEASTGAVHQLDSLGGFPSGLPPFRPLPASATRGIVPPSAIIPGFMPGLKALHDRFGRQAWRSLCAPAIHWAEHGHPVSSFEYGAYVANEKYFTYFPEGRSFFQARGHFTPVGETFVPPGLAETLRGVAEHGPDHMITGGWADQFVAQANAMGWAITLDHMDETPPRWIEPIRFPYRDHEIVTLGPPQAQGIIIAIALGVLKHLGIASMAAGSAEHLWAMAHALRQAARHWEYAQDETIYGVPRAELLDENYHAQLARLIQGGRPQVDLSEHVALSGTVPAPSGDTMAAYAGAGGKPGRGDSRSRQPTGSCEIAVVDAEGNWLQLMNTLQGSGIPGMVIGGVSMTGSNATFGHLMSTMDATLVKGAKGRCVIGNTLVLKDGRPVFSAGSPGNVHCTLPQVLSAVLDFGLSLEEAIDAPRMLPLSEGRRITIEDRLQPGAIDGLAALGVHVSVLPGYDQHMGSFSVIEREGSGATYVAYADPRRCAVADGIKS